MKSGEVFLSLFSLLRLANGGRWSFHGIGGSCRGSDRSLECGGFRHNFGRRPIALPVILFWPLRTMAVEVPSSLAVRQPAESAYSTAHLLSAHSIPIKT